MDFEQLSIDTLAKIEGFGIKSETVIREFKQSCKMLGEYLSEQNLEFSLENAQSWLSEIRPCDPMSLVQYNTYTARHRVIQLLAESQEGRLICWRVYRQKTAARPQTSDYLQLLHNHELWLREVGMAKATIAFSIRVDSDFLIYLEESGKCAISEVMPCDVIGYFSRNAFIGRKPDGVRAYAYKLRLFLVFLEEMGAVTEKKLSLAVPKVFAKQTSIVTVLSERAAKALRDGSVQPDVDTATRDRAMILLALRLGLRKCDIIKLTFGDIDWENDRITIIQQKTEVPITLPLLPDVGNAIMGYVLNHRPQVDCNTVFLRHYAPHTPLVATTNAVENYLSGFDSKDCPERGFHILRRTFATGMLRNSVPRSVISAALGQVDPNSADVYLSVDEENMRKCAISLAGIECTREDLQ